MKRLESSNIMFRLSIKDDIFLPHIGCDIDLTIGRGEIAVITGKNGLGKTSLMRRFYMEQQSECVFVEQGPLDSFYDRKLGIIKDIFLSLDSKDLNKTKFNDLWTAFHLDQKEDRYQSLLSGGEQQALKLCLGLAIERKLYLLDEPTQSLDDKSKSVINSWLRSEQNNSKSILIVEHSWEWLKFLNRIYQLKSNNNKLVLE